MQSVLIKNARIVDANTDVVSDLFVVNGKISEMGKKLDKSADEVCLLYTSDAADE